MEENKKDKPVDSCHNCGSQGPGLEEMTIRKSFAFGKNFPAIYEDMLLCKECRDYFEAKNEKTKKLAIVALAIILIFMGLNFALLFGSALS